MSEDTACLRATYVQRRKILSPEAGSVCHVRNKNDYPCEFLQIKNTNKNYTVIKMCKPLLVTRNQTDFLTLTLFTLRDPYQRRLHIACTSKYINSITLLVMAY